MPQGFALSLQAPQSSRPVELRFLVLETVAGLGRN